MRCVLPSCNDVWEAWEGREMRRDGVRVNAGGGRGLVPRPLFNHQINVITLAKPDCMSIIGRVTIPIPQSCS